MSSKVAVHLTTFHEGADGELKYKSTPSLTSGLVTVGGRGHDLDALPPEITSTPFVEICVDTMAGMEECGKSRPHWNSIREPSGP
jgi:hypothetical protein